jgi:hypothetical protein
VNDPSKFTYFRAISFLLSAGILVSALAGDLVFLRAGDDDEAWRVLFSDSPDGASGAKTDILLRPNKEQKFYTFVENASRRNRKVSVKLQVGNPPVELVSAPLVVAAGQTERFDFGKPAAAPAGAAAPSIELPGPPYRLQFVIADDKGKDLSLPTTYAGMLRPPQYLDIPEIHYESATQTLQVNVETLPDFSGPPCQVDLVLTGISGLDPRSARSSGSYRVTLQKGETRPLIAKGLHFLGSPPEKGYVYLTADGYERAFIFETTFTRQDTPVTPLRVAGKNPHLHLKCSPYSSQDPKFPVVIELDNATRSDVILELGWDPSGTGAFETREFAGDREQKARLNPKNAYGALSFETQVRDWSAAIDLSQTSGKIKLRGRLLDPNHKTLELETGDGQSTAEIVQTVVIDNTPPEVPMLLETGESFARGANHTFRIKALDNESGIESVELFFAPTPEEDKNKPKGGEQAAPPRDESGNGIWTATLTMPVDGTSTPLSIRAVNRSGLARWSRTITIPLVEATMVQASKVPKTGTIKGSVLDAGDRPQPNLTVTLTNIKSKEQTKTTTVNGEFTFENVPPGSYQLDCAKPEAGTKATVTVTVEAGKTADGSMKLGL